MGIKGKWRDRPITEKQAETLRDLAAESFRELTRKEASDLIQRWFNAKERTSYDNDILEDSK
tara:strand:- start:166 stop:351 length:186 start_codon:yes stop_codon:yes gene_type:complete